MSTKPTSFSVVNKQTNIGVEDVGEPLTYGTEAFLSPEYAKAEADRLWAKVWQMAGRVEEIPEIGSFITYEIGDDSIVVVRTAPDAAQGVSQCVPASRPPTDQHARLARTALAARSSVSSAASMAGPSISKARTSTSSTSRTGRARSLRSAPRFLRSRSTHGAVGSSSTWIRTA